MQRYMFRNIVFLLEDRVLETLAHSRVFRVFRVFREHRFLELSERFQAQEGFGSILESPHSVSTAS